MQLIDTAQLVLDTLKNHGYDAYFVGGCVRDVMLGKQPKDYDIATNATPEQVIPLFEKTLTVGAHFGVVIAVIGDFQFEIASYRADGVYTDGRRPADVNYVGTLNEDVLRRDFTINGLAMSTPRPKAQTQIKDYVNGRQDLENKIIRAIGDPYRRFKEDALRMMRAVRFAAQLDFSIATLTLRAIEDLAENLEKVSRERVREELIKILVSPEPAVGMALLFRTGLYRHVLPIFDVANAGELLRILEVAKRNPTYKPEFMLGLLASTIPTIYVEDLCQELRVSEFQRQVIYEMSRWRDFIAFNLVGWSKAGMKRRLRLSHTNYSLALFHVYAQAGLLADGLDCYDKCLQTVAVLNSEGLNPDRLLSGNDLMAVGLKGKAIGQVLEVIETHQLNGKIATADEARKLVQGEIRARAELGID